MPPPCRPHVTTAHPSPPLRLKAMWLHQTKGPSVVPSQARTTILGTKGTTAWTHILKTYSVTLFIYFRACAVAHMCMPGWGGVGEGEIRGQLLGLAFPFQCPESQGSNSGHHV